MYFEALFESKVFCSKSFLEHQSQEPVGRICFWCVLALAALKAGVSDPGATCDVVGGLQWFRYD